MRLAKLSVVASRIGQEYGEWVAFIKESSERVGLVECVGENLSRSSSIGETAERGLVKQCQDWLGLVVYVWGKAALVNWGVRCGQKWSSEYTSGWDRSSRCRSRPHWSSEWLNRQDKCKKYNTRQKIYVSWVFWERFALFFLNQNAILHIQILVHSHAIQNFRIRVYRQFIIEHAHIIRKHKVELFGGKNCTRYLLTKSVTPYILFFQHLAQ